jgi:hypothetical protein
MRTWMFGLVGVAALVTAASAQDKQDKEAVAVVTKAIDAHGGAEALNKYKAAIMKMKGTITVMGLDLDFTGTMSYMLPDKYKLVIDADFMGQKLSVEQIADGRNVKSTMNGMPIPLPENAQEELQNSATEMEIGTLTPLLNAEKFTIKSGGTGEVKGKKANVVMVTSKRQKEKEWKLFFDAESNLLVKSQRRGLSPDGQNEVDEETFMENYAKVDGIMTAKKMIVKHDGDPFITMEITEVQYKEKLDAKEFATDD